MRKPNKSRGEVGVTVAGEKLILCATMENLDRLEQETDGLSLVELSRALQLMKLSVVKAGLIALCVEGDAEAAWYKQVGVKDHYPVRDAISQALLPDPEGNAEPGAESR
ncbi:hypothetical protein [uncultured Roseibium sp.]|uniref:hypothetical protein n=1 Tax=uncultured Roseibium sp. TaxID=1936171 RepID=UPI002617B661|nr:hypothetical protein [uncultured Roseibium sp.]